MARINMAQLVMALAFAAAALLHGTAADDIVVGDSQGWSQPPSTSFYSNWAATKTFKVGDTLVFNFATGSHTVATVNKDAYDSCNTGNPINLVTNGPANIRLNATGQHYFICTFSGHCAGGQKLSINVVANSGSNSAPGPSGTGTGTGTGTTPPTNNNSGSSSGVTFAFILMFIALGLFF